MSDMVSRLLILYFAVICLVTCIVTVSDKIKAKKGKFRVREATLFTLAFLGGSAAEFITMQIIRHKTRHMKFMVGLPLIFVLQCIVLLYIADRFCLFVA